jgi:hypothetical protein
MHTFDVLRVGAYTFDNTQIVNPWRLGLVTSRRAINAGDAITPIDQIVSSRRAF